MTRSGIVLFVAGIALTVACGESDGNSGETGTDAGTGSTGQPTNGPGSTSGSSSATGPGTSATTGTTAGPGTSTGTTGGGGTGGSTGSTGAGVNDGLPSGVFGGGPFYNDADTVMPIMRASGFETMIIWTIHVENNGDFVLNDQLIVSDGNYVGNAGWPALVASLREEPTSVTRVEMGVGSYGVPDFERIQALLESEGSGPTSILYRNFQLLHDTFPVVDGINYDDESNYDLDSTVELSLMLDTIGFQITLTPYQVPGFWTALYDELQIQSPGLVDRVMLQVYAGGANNNPATWSGYFDGLQVEAGLWSRHGNGCNTGDTPATVQAKLEGWSGDIRGGWMWLLDDMLACGGQYPLEDYATAIHAAL